MGRVRRGNHRAKRGKPMIALRAVNRGLALQMRVQAIDQTYSLIRFLHKHEDRPSETGATAGTAGIMPVQRLKGFTAQTIPRSTRIMTTAIDSVERARFLQALRSVPDFRDEVRVLLLGQELLQLPERLAWGDFKGHVPGRIAREIADDIAERFGYEMLEVLTRSDLRQMLRQHRPDAINQGTRQGFYVADLVGKMLDQDGKELYLTLESSYTADRRDTDRAVRNAEFVTRFTGLPAVPAIASWQNDREVEQLVENGAVLWYQFSSRELNPE